MQARVCQGEAPHRTAIAICPVSPQSAPGNCAGGIVNMPHLLIVAALWLAVLSMGGGAEAAAGSVLERIEQKGVIKLGYRADAPPYSYRDEKQQPAGFIVDLCREVAAAVAAAAKGPVRTEYVLVAPPERFEAVREGRVDILCDPASVTLERRELVDFSIPTFLDGAGALSRAGVVIDRFEDLRNRKVGVLGGTTTEQALRGALRGVGVPVEIVTVQDHRTGLDLMTANRIDIYFADRAIIAAMILQNRIPGFQLSQRYFSYETYALAISRDDSAFRLLVDRTLAHLYRTGQIEQIITRTFGRSFQDEMLRAMVAIHSLPER